MQGASQRHRRVEAPIESPSETPVGNRFRIRCKASIGLSRCSTEGNGDAPANRLRGRTTMIRRERARRRRGLNLVEVIVLFVLISAAGLLMVMGIARAREQARLVGCRKNLAQIGVALALYDQFHHQLPKLGPPGAPDGP